MQTLLKRWSNTGILLFKRSWRVFERQLLFSRVVIVTMVTAGRFVEFPSCYFSHFFIDEAGHSTEPECLIALAGNAEFYISFHVVISKKA